MFLFHNEELRNDCFYAAHKLRKPIKCTSNKQDNFAYLLKILFSQAILQYH